jgi:hypothetical protein
MTNNSVKWFIFIYNLEWDLHENNKLLIQMRENNVLACVWCMVHIRH